MHNAGACSCLARFGLWHVPDLMMIASLGCSMQAVSPGMLYTTTYLTLLDVLG